MKVRLRLDPNQHWYVESKRWYEFNWQHENLFAGDEAYERAKDYALRLKYQATEEIT